MANKFDYYLQDMRPWLSGQVPDYQKFDAFIMRVRLKHNLPILPADMTEYRGLCFWRYGNETLIRSDDHVEHDSAQVFDPNLDGWIDLEAKVIEEWGSNLDPGPGPGPSPLPPLGTMRGNFLAAPGFEINPFGQNPVLFEYPGLFAMDQAAAQGMMATEGYSHIPHATKGGDWSRQMGWPEDYRFNFRNDLSRFKNEIVLPWRAQGVHVMLMVLGSHFSDPAWTVDSAKLMIDHHVNQLHDVIDWWVPVWEIDFVPGFQGTIDAQTQVLNHLGAAMTDKDILAYHTSPGKWAPAVFPDGANDLKLDWHRSVPRLNGVMYQRHWQETPSLIVDSTTRVAEVLRTIDRDTWLFEHSRNTDHWQRVVDLAKDVPLIKGWC